MPPEEGDNFAAGGNEPRRGAVVLVGAGPGDSALLTRAGADALARAEVVVYDRLVAPELLALTPGSARRIYVGKAPGHHAMDQGQINDLLVAEARAGRRVVRLKGGDPFVFGRGAEEAAVLREAGVPFRVVPGITAGIAGPAYAGIPVTHRGLATSIAFVTGHEDPTKGPETVDYAALARIDTVVFYMGVGHLPEIARRLVEAGRGRDTPAAVIERATTPRQRVVEGTLGTLPERAAEGGIRPPAVIIVGQVVALRDQVAWSERLPLWGCTVLVTRAAAQAGPLSSALAEHGCHVLELPAIEIEPIRSQALTAAVQALVKGDPAAKPYNWLALTSPNGVEQFFSVLSKAGGDARSLAGLQMAAIGPGTRDAMAERGIRADLMPGAAQGEALAEALIAAGGGVGSRVLLVRGEQGRAALPERLRAAGAMVEDLAVYRTVMPEASDAAVLTELVAGRVDVVTLASGLTARHLVSLVEREAGQEARTRLLEHVAAVAIGPITAAAAREIGFRTVTEACEATVCGLVKAVVRWAENRSG